jgi:hypothetical protein
VKPAESDHHFRAVQLPINLALSEAVRLPTQRIGDRAITLLEAAAELGVAVIASATLLQSKLASRLPQQMREALPGLSTGRAARNRVRPRPPCGQQRSRGDA